MLDMLLAGGLCLAGVTSFFCCLSFLLGRKASSRRHLLRSSVDANDVLRGRAVSLEVDGLWAKLITSLVLHESVTRGGGGLDRLWHLGLGGSDEVVRQAGLEGHVSAADIAWMRSRLVVGLGLGCFLLGFVFSEMLGLVLLVVGGLMGWVLPQLAIKREAGARTDAVERDLAQMLEIIVLGLRGGLSFDQAISYYGDYFSGSLSRSVALAKTQWSFGLLSREEALRSLAGSYGSNLVFEAVESISRSLRYGTTLANDLSELAGQTRAKRRTRLEEAVAKAPVKMLLPVGTLILPAMLILVVGPILLDLMNEF